MLVVCERSRYEPYYVLIISYMNSSSQKMFSDVKSNSVTRAGRHVDHALVSIYLVHIIVPVDVEVHQIGMLRL
jgi:hypothetical protein